VLGGVFLLSGLVFEFKSTGAGVRPKFGVLHLVRRLWRGNMLGWT
jgi:hypothetical protein